MPLPTKEALLFVHPEIEKRLRKAQCVEDVLERRVASGVGSSKYSYAPAKVVHITSEGGKGEQAPKEILDNKYLPKGKLESPDDYARRMAMTPYFPELPHIIQDRIGAIFSEAPELDGAQKEQFQDFELKATSEGEPLVNAAANSAAWIQRVGFQGCFIDRAKLDAESQAKLEQGALSQAEAKIKKLGEPRLVFYRPEQILDFGTDDKGLTYVKVIEFYMDRGAWSDKPKALRKVRIIGRNSVQCFTIDDQDKIESEPEVAHGYADEDGPAVPFVFVHSPIDVWSQLGGSMLIEPAEADISCTRLLSDIVWALYLLGNPILCFWTQDQTKNLDTNVGRYVRLMPAMGSKEEEKLAYVVLDTNGLDLQLTVHNTFKAQGRNLAGRVGDAVFTEQPREVSGVSRAWEFKTGEQRVLFLITQAIQQAYNKILKIVAIMKGLDPKQIKIKFNTNFDIGSPKDALDVSEKILDIVTKLEMPEAKKLTLRKILDLLGPRTEEEEEAIDDEIEEAGNKEYEPPTTIPGNNQGNLGQQGMAEGKRVQNQGAISE